MITERQRYRNWLAAQKADHGLIDVRVCTAADPLGPDVTTDELAFGDHDEAFYRELNEVNAAVARGDCREITDF